MTVLITGASSGIGRDIAREFAKKKYKLILIARDENKLNQVRQDFEKITEVKTIVMDLSDVNNCKKLYEENKDIDILINNAGFGDFGYFSETDLNKELNMINTNIIAVHVLTKLYLKQMEEKNSGIILNVASIAGAMTGPLMATYYSTKAYVVRLSEAIREELNKKKSKVRISVLMPGPVKTNFNNVANVKFEINSLTSEYVAKYTVKKLLKNKFYIVPGFTIKGARFFAKVIPTKIIAKCCYHMQKKKI